MSPITAARLRHLADEHETAAAQLRSAAQLVERDPENPDVATVLNGIVERLKTLTPDDMEGRA